jgi:hypothetical protein
VFDNGCIAERGCFEDLLLRNGLFAELVASQLTPPESVAALAVVPDAGVFAEAAD